MTDHWKSGYKLVIANRTNREESLFQKLFSNTYHYLMRKYAFPEAPAGGFDLILFDSQLRTDILRLNERNLNLPYLFIWLGYEFVTVPYIRQKREIGKSRWTFSKKLTAFADAFCGFTYFPIRMISILGGICALIAVIYAMVIVVTAFISGSPVPGWASLMTVILFVSALQFVSIGILGEYLWRTLASTRVRPNFVVDNVLSQGMPSPRPLDPLAWSKADSLTPEHSRNQIPL
jgi:dolichol-phosphate mannosyltransferase